jgi:hypothetical protein
VRLGELASCNWNRGVQSAVNAAGADQRLRHDLDYSTTPCPVTSRTCCGLHTVVPCARAENETQGEQAEEVTPPEDLMREHGVLDRVLLIYDAAIRRLSANKDFDPAVISDSAKLVQDFIENYHEKSEEDFLFPRFRQARREPEALHDTEVEAHDVRGSH